MRPQLVTACGLATSSRDRRCCCYRASTADSRAVTTWRRCGRRIPASRRWGRLSPAEAALYQEWIANDRQLRQLVEQMRQVAAKAAELKLKEAVSQEAEA